MEQVRLWFKVNQDVIAKKQVQPKPYESDNLKIRRESVRGICYVISKLTENQKRECKLDIEVGQTAFFRVELSLNMKTQMLMVNKENLHGISKLTFNEIDLVESHNISLTANDYTKNNVDPNWAHFFHLAVRN